MICQVGHGLVYAATKVAGIRWRAGIPVLGVLCAMLLLCACRSEQETGAPGGSVVYVRQGDSHFHAPSCPELGGGGQAYPASEAASLGYVPCTCLTVTLSEELKAYPHKLLCESYRDGNWELMLMNADGSDARNLTNTPDLDELFAHASPDGKRVVFVVDTGPEDQRERDVYFMNIDGTGRTLVAENGRQPFWGPNSRTICYAQGGAFVFYKETTVTNNELRFYDIETGTECRPPRKDIWGLMNPCWSPDGNWILTTVDGAMGFRHSMLAIEVNGTRKFELRRSKSEDPSLGIADVWQCRPDISPDGKHLAWGKERSHENMWVEVCDVHLDAPEPYVDNLRHVVSVKHPNETYHVDWSPDGKYIAYCRGDRGTRMAKASYIVGAEAPGWNIWVVDPSNPEVTVAVTLDGRSNKEPDWVPVR